MATSTPTPRVRLSCPVSNVDVDTKRGRSRARCILRTPSSSRFRRLSRHHQPRRCCPDPVVVSLFGKTSGSGGDSGSRRWDSLIHDALQGVVRWWGNYLNSYWSSVATKSREEPSSEHGAEQGKDEKRKEKEEEWDWDRWKRHFAEIEERERLVLALKAELRAAIAMEDYEDAVKLKMAIKTARKNDDVGRAIMDLDTAITEERYTDAAYLRDHAGIGLIGWWVGLSKDIAEPYGIIVRIHAEYGRYVAKGYTSRQLISGGPGSPLFEVYFKENNGEYKQQAVYLRGEKIPDGFGGTSEVQNDINSVNRSDSFLGSRSDVYNNTNLNEDDDADLAAFGNVPPNVFPGFRIKVVKVPIGNVDKDFMSKIIEEVLEDNEEDDDTDMQSKTSEDDGVLDVDDLDSPDLVDKLDVDNEIPEFFSVGSLKEEETWPLPAKLERRDRFSFSLHIEQGTKKQETSKARQRDVDFIQHRIDLLVPRLVKMIGAKKISVKIVNLTQMQSNVIPKLGGQTHFIRILNPYSSDPLTGLYVSAMGFDAEIICLQHKFGHWQNDEASKSQREFEFYEYVEAIKLTGEHLVPSGQVAFRAKVGKRNQLPHKGIIPKELGVVARYRGQGRISDPGFENLRWVDGELLILDGGFSKEGPVVAFFYWGGNYNHFEFFNRLRLPE